MGAAGVGAQALRVFGPEAETSLPCLADAGHFVLFRDYSEDAGCDLLDSHHYTITKRQLVVPAAFTIRWLVRLVYPLVWMSTRLTQVVGQKS